MATPNELWWVEYKGSKSRKYCRRKAGAKGGKVSSLQAAKDRKAALLGFDPEGSVTIYRTECDWIEENG